MAEFDDDGDLGLNGEVGESFQSSKLVNEREVCKGASARRIAEVSSQLAAALAIIHENGWSLDTDRRWQEALLNAGQNDMLQKGVYPRNAAGDGQSLMLMPLNNYLEAKDYGYCSAGSNASRASWADKVDEEEAASTGKNLNMEFDKALATGSVQRKKERVLHMGTPVGGMESECFVQQLSREGDGKPSGASNVHKLSNKGNVKHGGVSNVQKLQQQVSKSATAASQQQQSSNLPGAASQQQWSSSLPGAAHQQQQSNSLQQWSSSLPGAALQQQQSNSLPASQQQQSNRLPSAASQQLRSSSLPGAARQQQQSMLAAPVGPSKPTTQGNIGSSSDIHVADAEKTKGKAATAKEKAMTCIDKARPDGEGADQIQNLKASLGPAKSPSKWSSLLKSCSNSRMNLEYFKPIISEEKVKVKPPPVIAKEGAEQWESTLVGYFMDKKLPFYLVNNIAKKLWDSKGLVKMLIGDNGFYFFKFFSASHCEEILEGGPWHFAGRPIVLKKWQQNMSFTKEHCKTVPIWVNFYNVPLEFWTDKGLSYIASAVGKPLYADSMTAEVQRIQFARICIEVSNESLLPETIELEVEGGNMVEISVEYNWVPKICAQCKEFGHTNSKCKMQTKQEWQIKKNKDQEVKQQGEWVEVRKHGKAIAVEPDIHNHQKEESNGIGGPTSAEASSSKPQEFNVVNELAITNRFQSLKDDEVIKYGFHKAEVSNFITESTVEAEMSNVTASPDTNPIRDKLVAVDELDKRRLKNKKRSEQRKNKGQNSSRSSRNGSSSSSK